MITATIMKKKQMGIFENMGGNIPRWNFLVGIFQWGNSPGESLIGGNFPGGSFPDTESKSSRIFLYWFVLTKTDLYMVQKYWRS